ncbi:UNVERIFIED_CONTAM: hypothetical protein NCL1_41559 [Trichonephila clavipes]
MVPQTETSTYASKMFVIHSLQHMACVRIAILVCEDPEVKALEKEIGFPMALLPSKKLKTLLEENTYITAPPHFPLIHHLTESGVFRIKWWTDEVRQLNVNWNTEKKALGEHMHYPACIETSKRWENLVKKKVTSFSIPTNLRKEIENTVRFISLEIAKWKKDQFPFVLKIDDVTSYIKWKSNGTIDTRMTYKTLIQCEELDISQRFRLACRYCTVDEVKAFWNQTPESDRRSVLLGNIHTFAFSLLEKGLLEKERIDLDETSIRLLQNQLGLTLYFNKLSPEMRHERLATRKYLENLHLDEVCFCLSKMEDNELIQLAKARPRQLLEFFLSWPFQIAFLDVASCLWNYLNETEFLNLLGIIIYERIIVEWGDYDYVELLKEFWRQSPRTFKDYIARDAIYPPLISIVNSKDKNSFASEVLKDYKLNCYSFQALGIEFKHFDVKSKNPGIRGLNNN